jgi:hypothetical protein
MIDMVKPTDPVGDFFDALDEGAPDSDVQRG